MAMLSPPQLSPSINICLGVLFGLFSGELNPGPEKKKMLPTAHRYGPSPIVYFLVLESDVWSVLRKPSSLTWANYCFIHRNPAS